MLLIRRKAGVRWIPMCVKRRRCSASGCIDYNRLEKKQTNILIEAIYWMYSAVQNI